MNFPAGLLRRDFLRRYFASHVLLVAWAVMLSPSFALAGWEGVWETGDQWGSSYQIEIRRDGTAYADYADGWNGQWREESGNLAIEWDSGWRDYIFNGVMGRQRLASKEGQRGYTSYIRPAEKPAEK